MDDQDIQDVLQAIEREVTEIVLQVDTVDVDDQFVNGSAKRAHLRTFVHLRFLA